MASTPNNTGNPIFNQGEFMKRLELWLNDPSQSENPIVPLLNCLPKCDYTNQDYTNVKATLNQIINESQFYESKQIYNQAVDLKNSLSTIECIGEDACVLFNGYFLHSLRFIEWWSTVKDSQVLVTQITQNPNYYNN